MHPTETENTEVVVIGAGPGGYAAAFHAADRGHRVILVERDERLGGTCLNRGCIPSKAYLHATQLIEEARFSKERGIVFAEPSIELRTLRAWKESVLERLGSGIRGLAKARGVMVIHGRGHFEDSNTLRVENEDGQRFVKFRHAIIATGSKPALPRAFDLGSPRVITSDEALELNMVRDRLLIIGAGYIGMELGTVYSALGSAVTMIESATALAGADADLIQPVMKKARQKFADIRLHTRVVEMSSSGSQIRVLSECTDAGTNISRQTEAFDAVLVAVGRAPNCDDLGLANTKVLADPGGFIDVDANQQTADPAILAIGDVTGGVMLAHKAAREARIAVDTISGSAGESRNELLIPAVVFTHPEIAWVGLTEAEAREKQIPHRVVRFPWAGLGRAQTMAAPEGLTKLIVDESSERILGVGIVGQGAGELIGEGTLAIEMGATAYDLAQTIHPHPTLSESLMECAELFYGTSTHAAVPKQLPENSTPPDVSDPAAPNPILG